MKQTIESVMQAMLKMIGRTKQETIYGNGYDKANKKYN